MRPHLRALLWQFTTALAAAAQAPTAVAATPATTPSPATWTCSLSKDLVQLVCHADGSPLAEPATPEEMDRADPREQAGPPPASPASTSTGPTATITATVNGTRFPLDVTSRWTVELWSVPTDADNVALLARATICYRSPGCTVRVLPWTDADQNFIDRLAYTVRPRGSK